MRPHLSNISRFQSIAVVQPRAKGLYEHSSVCERLGCCLCLSPCPSVLHDMWVLPQCLSFLKAEVVFAMRCAAEGLQGSAFLCLKRFFVRFLKAKSLASSFFLFDPGLPTMCISSKDGDGDRDFSLLVPLSSMFYGLCSKTFSFVI